MGFGATCKPLLRFGQTLVDGLIVDVVLVVDFHFDLDRIQIKNLRCTVRWRKARELQLAVDQVACNHNSQIGRERFCRLERGDMRA